MKRKEVTVAHFDDSYFPVMDGVAIAVDNHAKILNDMGNESFVVTIKLDGANDSEYPYKIYRSKSLKNPTNKIYRWPIIMVDFEFKKQLKEKKIDIIHLHSPFMVGHYGLRLARKKKIPVFATFHTKFQDDLMEALHSKILTKIVLGYVIRLFNKCDYVITVTEYAKRVLYSYGYKGDIYVIPNGCDLKKPENPKAIIKEIRNEYQIKPEEDLMLFVGAQNYKKNIKLIFKSLAIYKKQNKPFKMLMVGEGCHEEALKKYGESLGLKDNIIYTGKILDREKVAKLYTAANLFVFPSMYDTFALVVREAAVCETASVVVKETGPAESIVDGVNGFLTENNAEDLASKISFALGDKDNLAKVAKEAMNTLPITWEEVVAQVSELYHEAIDKKKN